MQVDIIVPIYNAYEYTVDCIKSVIKNTDLSKNNLILINDKSTDERVAKFLDGLSKYNIDNIKVIHNEINLGFVGTVNKGMNLSNNDVLLLNSDTEVTTNWLQKMVSAAYLNTGIGTVTALTNNGTICSVPNFCEDNEIPNGFSVDEYAEIIEKTSLKLYPSIPTAVGFCMYIKREVLDKVGFFDMEAFGKGYGEENDFCCRAIEHGYYHIMADDTFVYHKGSTSFLGNKEKLSTNNLKVLNARYPYYDHMIQEFIQANPLKTIHENIKLQIKLRNNNKNVLYILHNDFLKGENHPVGGTEYHTKDIIENLDDTNAFVVYVSNRKINMQVFIDDEVFKFCFNISDKICLTEYTNYQYKKEMSKILDYFAIDCIHIQHLRTHTLDIIDLAKEKNIPVYITLHDFYCICPKVNLLDVNGEYCIESRCDEMCRKCIRQLYHYNEDIMEDWNNVFYQKLKMIDKIFVPSESAKNIIEGYYKEKYQDFNINIEVREHGISRISNNSICPKDNEPFRIAFIGGLAPYKGSKMACKLIKSKLNVEWHLFGNIGDYELEVLERANLIKHGRYEREDIIELLRQQRINLICILSTCPETYSYTISEAISAQIPMLVTDIGALGERVRRYKCGWVINNNSSCSQIVHQIEEIINNSNDYSNKLNEIKKVKLPTKQEVATQYNMLYHTKHKRKILSNVQCNYSIMNNFLMNNVNQIEENKVNSNSEVILALQEEINQLRNTINVMSNTMGWKFLNYIRRYMPRLNALMKTIVKKLAKFKR